MTPEFKRLLSHRQHPAGTGHRRAGARRYQPWPGRLARRSLFWLKNKQQGMSRGARILPLPSRPWAPSSSSSARCSRPAETCCPRHCRRAGPAAGQGASLLWSGRPSPDRREPGFAPVEALFDDFDETPLASASIAQVHTARLKGERPRIVIKVIRPDIEPVIEADLRLMQALGPSGGLFRAPRAGRLRPVEVVGGVSQDHTRRAQPDARSGQRHPAAPQLHRFRGALCARGVHGPLP